MDTVEIARKQRHLHLLEKVKQNKPLTPAELNELSGYEKTSQVRPAMPPKTITIVKPLPAVKPAKGESRKKPKGESRKKPKGESRKKPKGKSRKKPKGKSRKKPKAPVSAAAVKAAAIECNNFADTETRLGLKQTLAVILEQYPRLMHAWRRGRFLGDVRALASTAVTIEEAEQSLVLEQGELKKIFESDKELSDIWHRARLQIIIDVKTAMVKQAREGRPTAARQIESIIRSEIAKPRFDYRAVTNSQLIEITGKTRMTIHNWHTKYGLPQNSDKTYNLIIVFQWFEEFIVKKTANAAAGSFAALDPLKARKAEKIAMEIDQQRGELLSRDIVMAGQMARQQNLVSSLTDTKAKELAMVCRDQPMKVIEKTLQLYFNEIRQGQCQVGEELYLPDDIAKRFSELLNELKPESK